MSMKWFGVLLAIAGVIIALAAWFGFENVPTTIAGGVFFVLGLIVFWRS